MSAVWQTFEKMPELIHGAGSTGYSLESTDAEGRTWFDLIFSDGKIASAKRLPTAAEICESGTVASSTPDSIAHVPEPRTWECALIAAVFLIAWLLSGGLGRSADPVHGSGSAARTNYPSGPCVDAHGEHGSTAKVAGGSD